MSRMSGPDFAHFDRGITPPGRNAGSGATAGAAFGGGGAARLMRFGAGHVVVAPGREVGVGHLGGFGRRRAADEQDRRRREERPSADRQPGVPRRDLDLVVSGL
jgi:hypothetical protein